MYPLLVTAVFHHLAPHARVIGIDHIQGLVDMSKENLRKDGIPLGEQGGGVEILCGDGRLGTFACSVPSSSDLELLTECRFTRTRQVTQIDHY